MDPVFLSATQAGSQLMDSVDLASTACAVECPLLLIQADPTMGAALTQEDIDIVLANAPNARLLKVPSVGHMIHDERPADFILGIDTFLAEP